MKELKEINNQLGSNNNKNDVRVTNNFTLNINLGDPLNLFAIIGGIYIVSRLVKKRK
ncbi:hypothetical protein AB7942_17290 [Neobacillus sp. BF23-41]|uniref:hypothetical protein n=1 Tax=Neobacillus sp. BF23-41 TaxID=3240280 RepID=UPI0034E397A5